MRPALLAPLVLVAGTVGSAVSAFAQAAPAQQPAWVASQRAAVMQALDVPGRLPALDAHTWSSFSPMAGVIADRVTYATADGMLVPAVVYRPDPAALRAAHFHGKLPGLVIVNGHGSDKYGWYAFYSGMLFARAGAVVVTYDPIGEGERNADRISMQRPSPHDADVTPPAPLPHDDWGRRLAGLMQVDLAQAVSYLRAQPEVDAARIATAGYSLGSFVVGVEGAWDTRVHAVLLSAGGDFDGAGGYFDVNKGPCQGPPYRTLAVLGQDPQTSTALAGFAPVTPPIGDRGPVLYALNAARGATFVMNGGADTVMDIPHHDAAWFAQLRERTLRLTGPATQQPGRNVFTTVFFPGISHRTSWVLPVGMDWLNGQLHFAFWNTDAKIAAQGSTHVSTWITANHVAISPNYFREDREGGLDAVGTGFPALTRAQLTVLPDADWHRLESQLTYKAWAAKALAAESALAKTER